MSMSGVLKMVSDLTRREIWHSRWDADALSRYYQALNRRYWVFDMTSMCLLVLGGLATIVVTFLTGLPSFAYWIVGSSVTVVSIWVMLAGFARKAAMSHAISQQCGELMRELEDLHSRIDLYLEKDELEVRDKYIRLRRRLDEVSERSGDFGLPCNDDKYLRYVEAARVVMEKSNVHGRASAAAG